MKVCLAAASLDAHIFTKIFFDDDILHRIKSRQDSVQLVSPTTTTKLALIMKEETLQRHICSAAVKYLSLVQNL